MLVFEERGNQSTRRKPLGAEKRTNKLNPHMTPDLGIEGHIGGRRELSPLRHPCIPSGVGGALRDIPKDGCEGDWILVKD